MPLLTIVFTDVVESTATKRDASLGRDDRERDHAYLERVQTRHFDLVRECCKAHGGREISNMGDAFYLAFDDPMEGVRCTVEIQKRLAASPIETPRGPLRLRMGIHSGFPEPFEGSWHGTDVDLAARVEAQAGERQILISARTYELVRHMTDVTFCPHGEFALKGLDRISLWEVDWDGTGPRPTVAKPLSAHKVRRRAVVFAGVLVAIIAAATVSYQSIESRRSQRTAGAFSGAPARRSVAVLGFKNLGKKDADWLSTALSEMFSSELGAGEEVRTIPGENVARARIELSLPAEDSYAPDTLARLRKVLNADDVIVGSYLALNEGADGQIRLDLRAQDTIVCNTVCSISETGVEGNLFDLVARAGTELRRHLGLGNPTQQQADAMQASFPRDPAVAQLYSEGLADLRRFDALDGKRSLERVVELKPDFAMGHSALSAAWSQLGYRQKSNEEAKKAVDLAAGLSREDQLSIQARYEASVTDWTKSIETYRTLWDFFPDNLEYGLLLVGTEMRGGQVNNALQDLEKLRHLPSPERDDPRLDLSEADGASHLSDFDRQLKAANQAIAKSQTIGARLINSRALVLQGRAYASLGQTKYAIDSYKQARQLSAAAGNRGQEASAVYQICIVLEDESEYAQARKTCEQSLAIHREIGSDDGVAFDLNEIGIIMRHQADLRNSRKMFDEALEVFEKLDDAFNQAVELGNTGNVLEDEGDLAGAVAKYKETIPLFQKIGNRGGEAISLANIGNTEFQLGEMAESYKYFDQALAIEKQIGAKGPETFALLTSGQAYLIGGDLATAKSRCKEAMDLAKDSSYKGLESNAMSCLGEAARMEGDLLAARQLANQALSIRTEAGEKGDVALSQVALGELQIDEGHASEAIEKLRKAQVEFRNEGNPTNELTAAALLIDALIEAKQFDEARSESMAETPVLAKCQDLSTNLDFKIAAARAQAASRKSSDIEEARKSLQAIVEKASASSFLASEFEGRLALGKLDLQSNDLAQGRATLESLHTDASAKGFKLIAGQAVAALK